MGVEGNMSAFPDGSSSDRYFLLNFVMSNYLGPDLYSDNPRCSAYQRIARIFPPYTLKHLGASFLSVSQLESLYYYVLRYAEPNLVVEQDVFHMYLKGKLPLGTWDFTGESRQFTSFFPLNVHEHKRYSPTHEIVKGIVLIDDPAVSYISKEDLQRFRCLSRLDDLKIDRVISLSYRCGLGKSHGEEQNNLRTEEATSTEAVSDQNCNSSGELRETRKSRDVVVPDRNLTSSAELQETCTELQETCKSKTEETVGENGACGTRRSPQRFLETYKRRRRSGSAQKVTTSAGITPLSTAEDNGNTAVERDKTVRCLMLPLAAVPNAEELVSDASIKLTGTAARGTPGPPVGIVDIGVSKVAYFFQVSLPGLSKDYCEFSCEVESDGKVILQGSTSGGKTIKKRSRVFEMNLRQLCPPGPFTLSFSLPGPVDPRLFSPNFRSDGIFEAVIIRHRP